MTVPLIQRDEQFNDLTYLTPYIFSGVSSRGSVNLKSDPLPSTVRKKQDRYPSWQAAPTWSTWTNRVSPSQSKAMSLTVWMWPLVSPFIQDFWRERLQKWV